MRLVVIGGATAVGKSEVACLVAERIRGEIISADSMAVYRGMDIGTAKPLECMGRIRHHLVDILDPGDYFDAKLFEEYALRAIEEIKKRGNIPIVAGGTYLYIQALLFGLPSTPPPNWKLRNRLYRIASSKGSAYLYEKLKAVDPAYAQKIHPNDLRRIVRAIEVFTEGGKPFSSFHSWSKPKMDFAGFHITRDRENLFRRIELRVKRMVEEGLVEEVKTLVEKGFENFLTSAQAIGYKELIPYLRGEISLEEAIQRIIKNTKEYAKRQIRWFRKQGWREINLDKVSPEEACEVIVSSLSAGRKQEP